MPHKTKLFIYWNIKSKLKEENMNLFRMDKEEYRKFRIFINIMVFIAFLAVFFFVEKRREEYRQDDVGGYDKITKGR